MASRTPTRSSRRLVLTLSLILFLALSVAAFATPGRAFVGADKLVAAYVFHWFTATGGQTAGVWHPVEGRIHWDGSVDFWKRQIKDMMDANLDLIYVHLIPAYEPERVNLFTALGQLRAAGYRVPQVAPFLDPAITYDPGSLGPIDLCTTAGKDSFADQYVRFYTQYRAANLDAEGDSYLATMDGKPMVATWALDGLNPGCFSRTDLESRLAAALGAPFTPGLYMVSLEGGSGFAWANELNRVFVGNYGGAGFLIDGISATVKPGQWDPSIDLDPARYLARSGGTTYSDSWDSILGNPSLKRVHIESWNEYVEGTGLYEADPSKSWWQEEHYPQRSDSWGATARRYIDLTAQKGAPFNTVPELGASFLQAPLPAQLEPGETVSVPIVVRNEGDTAWSNSTGFKLSLAWGNGAGATYPLNDAANEVDARDDPLFSGLGGYGGVFRGRPVTFPTTFTAPVSPATYNASWRMKQVGTGFGATLAWPVKVMVCEAPVAPTTVYATLGIGAYGDNYFCGDLGEVKRTADFVCSRKGYAGALSYATAAKPPGSFCAYKTAADTPNYGLSGNWGHGTQTINGLVCNACGAYVQPTTVYATLGIGAYGNNYFCGDLGDPQRTANFICTQKGYVGGAVFYRIAAKPAGSFCAYKTPADAPNSGLSGNWGHGTQVINEVQCTNHVP
jgi:hypothetical protein